MKQNQIKEITILNVSMGIFNFANSMVEIFIPLYLLEKGYQLSMIILFYAISQASRFLFLPLGASFSSSFGAKKALSASFVLSIAFYLLLRGIDYSPIVFYISAFFFGMIMAFLYLPFLVHQSKISPNNNRGRTISKISIYSALASAAGPLIGGLIISSFGFKFVFLIAILSILPAILILLSTPEISKIRKINFHSIFISKISRDLVANGFYNYQSFSFMAICPIFIFSVLGEYEAMGSIQTASLAISVLAFYIAGKFADKFDRNKLLFISSLTKTFADLLFVFVNSTWRVFLFNTGSVFATSMQAVPWNAKLLEHADKESRTEYVAIFEMGGSLIACIGLLILCLLIQNMPLWNALALGIILSSLAGLFINLVRK